MAMLPESNEACVEELLKKLVMGGPARMDHPFHTCSWLTGLPRMAMSVGDARRVTSFQAWHVLRSHVTWRIFTCRLVHEPWLGPLQGITPQQFDTASGAQMLGPVFFFVLLGM